MNRFFIAVVVLVLSGCAAIPADRMPITTEQREFTYDYSAPEKSKKELFRDARNYFALSYGNSKEVSRIEDEDQGTIIGKALVRWNLSTDSFVIQNIPCVSNYNIIFVAKDGKARLQLTLMEGALPPCRGWASPPKRDYPQILQSFNDVSEGLGRSLHNQSAVDRLKNF